MALADLFQEFGSAVPGAEPVSLLNSSEEEEQGLVQYEKGYAAGWEDSLTLQIEEKSRISEALKSNLEDLEFTFAEARVQVLGALAPVFDLLVEQVLPEAMQHSAGARISEVISQLASEAADGPVGLHVAPGQVPVIQPLVKHALGDHLPLTEDETLTDGQVQIVMGGQERLIDPAPVLQQIADALSGFNDIVTSEAQND